MSKKNASQIFFISDTHFYHEKVINFCNRPFKTVDEMNEYIIKKWNTKVRDQDIVYVLGDFQWYTKNDILDRLKGKKILIRGNHDLKSNQMVRRGFNFAVEEAVIIIAGQRVILSHYPYRYTKWQEFKKFLQNPYLYFKTKKPRCHDRRPINRGGWLLCGHCHSKEKQWDKTIHCGWDAWHDLIPIQKIESIINSYENKENIWKKFIKIYYDIKVYIKL